MPTTCVITGYKLGASSIIVYGFILSGTVFNPGDIAQPDINDTIPETTAPVITSPTPPDIDVSSICGLIPPRPTKPFGMRNLENPISRLLLSMMTKRILGGTDTDEGDWPWMAYLYEKMRGTNHGFFCGGALINRRWIVSAAHCIKQPNSPEVYGVILGEHSVSKFSKNERHFDLERIVRHEDFFGSSYNNDVALLKLAEDVQFTDFIRPVCLVPPQFPTDATVPEEFDGELVTYAGTICTVLGWGRTETGNRTDTMQQLNVIIVPHLLCSSITSNPSEPYFGRSVNENDPKFCAGGALGEDTCAGDSGGPLLCIRDERYFLHGVTSYGTDPCGQEKKPGIYTRMADFHGWVMANIS